MKHDLPFWYEQLKQKYPVVTDEEWRLLHHMAAVKHIRKGDSFLKYGKVARFSAFVISGLFKFSIQDEDDNEKIIRFGFANDSWQTARVIIKRHPRPSALPRWRTR
jgi:CRP-like cAMP-binding protein